MSSQILRCLVFVTLVITLGACQGKNDEENSSSPAVPTVGSPPPDSTAGETPTPVVQTPAPVVETPAPVVETPAPVVQPPAPIHETPPISETTPPVPEPTTPGPEVPIPGPVISDPSPETPPPAPAPELEPGECEAIAGTIAPGIFEINNGEPATNSPSVELKFHRDLAIKMRISADDHCGCGTWEAFVSTKPWTLIERNQLASISVQFKDSDGNYSKCAKNSILHDDQPPVIQLNLDPSNTYLSGADTKLNLKAIDLGIGIESLVCTLNETPVDCPQPNSPFVLSKQNAGTYIYQVSATDFLGLSTSKSVSWTVTKPNQKITQEYEVKTNTKVDILFVVDNSSSMALEQKKMAERIDPFLSQLTGLDWRIAVTTTDPRNQEDWGDGKLLVLKGHGKDTFLTSDMDLKKSQKTLGDTIERKEIGSSLKQGIYATYRTLERSLDPKDSANQFLRADANFAAIVISNGNESADGTKNKPENLLQFVRTTWPSKNFSFNSIIAKTGDEKCGIASGHQFGTAYEKMSYLSGSGMIGAPLIGSVCEVNYANQLKGLGATVQSAQKNIQLNCNPQGDATSSVAVMLNGANYSAPYMVQADRIVFSENLMAGRYTLKYQCQ
jgi:hypothetical protein